jgi:menaquinone-9 beta-reductase
LQSDVLVVGGGPAGLATAIAARLKGLCVTVVDVRKPPIDKPCGEGLLPHGAAALDRLGIDLNSSLVYPFSGFRFSDEKSSASAQIPSGNAFGIRRTVLHRLLVDRASDVGVSFAWDTRALRFSSCGVHTSNGFLPCRWLVGADGDRSSVGRFAGLEARRGRRFRFGFRRHYEVAPWTDRVEVRWGEKCQVIVTPTGPSEICVSLFASDPRLRLDRALDYFPDVARRISGARPRSSEVGAITLLSRARAAARGNVALVGDASCTVDGIAGQGLSLAFRQALHLADALACGDLAKYESARRRIIRTPMRITRLLLAMNASSALRRKVLRLFAARPALFARMISIHTGESTASPLGAAEILNLGWRVIWA